MRFQKVIPKLTLLSILLTITTLTALPQYAAAAPVMDEGESIAPLADGRLEKRGLLGRIGSSFVTGAAVGTGYAAGISVFNKLFNRKKESDGSKKEREPVQEVEPVVVYRDRIVDEDGRVIGTTNSRGGKRRIITEDQDVRVINPNSTLRREAVESEEEVELEGKSEQEE